MRWRRLLNTLRNAISCAAQFVRCAGLLSPSACSGKRRNLAAGISAFCSAFVDLGALRETVVAFATLESDQWSAIAKFWHNYAWFCAAGVLVWRVLTTKAAQRVTRRVRDAAEHWLNTLEDAFATSPARRAVTVIAPMSAVLILLLVAFTTKQQASQNIPAALSQPITKPKPIVSAALTLPDGSIQSGLATIERRGESFVVEFKQSDHRGADDAR